MAQTPAPSNYTMGYSAAVTGSHSLRTIHSDAAFLLPHIRPGDHILDLGCGPGTITVGFASLVPAGSVTGVDLSEAVLFQARALAARDQAAGVAAAAAGNMTFQVADVLAGLPFADGTFDVVFSSQLFPHMATLDMRLRTLAEMRRVLKVGGILATRDAADLCFYPSRRRRHGVSDDTDDDDDDDDLNRLFVANMIKVLRHADSDTEYKPVFPGGEMPALYRRVGFGVDGAGRVTVGAGTTVHAGRDERAWYAKTNIAKLSPGDPNRDSWLKAGISAAEIDKAKAALERWAEDDDAWYVGLQAEILAWK